MRVFNILDRHIGLALIGAAAMTSLVLLGLTGFISFVEELDWGQRHGLGLAEVLLLTLLKMPELLFELFPLIVLLGSILGLGALAASGELVVMQAAGMQVWRIAFAAGMAGLALGLLSLLIGDRIVPLARMEVAAIKSGTERNEAAQRSLWLRQSQQFMHFGDIVSPELLRDVHLYDISEAGNELVSVHSAAEVNYQQGRWVATDYEIQRPGEQQLTREGRDSIELQLGVAPELLELFLLRADSLSLPGLRRYINYLDGNKLDAHQPRLEYWRKLAIPLSVVVMVLIAVPFVLGPLRDTGAGQRLFVGVLIGIVFYVSNETVASMGAVYRWPPLLAAFGPTVLLGGIAAWRLARY